MRVILFSHESDVDGIFSTAIGLIRYPQARTFFLDYSKESFMKIINQFFFSNESQEKNLYIISDLGFNDSLLSIFKSTLNNLNKIKNEIIWVDHHPWSKNTIDEIHSFVELILDDSGKKCATELMYERFLLDNDYAKHLANIAHSTDFFVKDQYITPLPEIIRYYLTFNDSYERLSKLAHKISMGVLWDIQLSEDYKKYEFFRDNDKKQVLEELKIKKIDDLNVVFVRSTPYLQTSLFSEEIFNKTKADLAIFYGKNGKISIRRNNEKIDCNAIALKLIDGGGHKFAAGGTIRSDPNNVKDIISEIEETILKIRISNN
ncbi:MAG TPA: DHHA1 domain-containing protein [Nitrososphaeraceae archaeon]|nr:DHHA1 domain-containing protein [Nitrososphaeraceae archaeon]